MRGKREIEREEGRRIWEGHLREWESSGLSQAEYCRRKGLSVKTFGYRKRTLKGEGSTICLVEAPAQPLCVSGPCPGAIRLVLGNRLHIEIERHFDPDTLRQLLEVLGR